MFPHLECPSAHSLHDWLLLKIQHHLKCLHPSEAFPSHSSVPSPEPGLFEETIDTECISLCTFHGHLEFEIVSNLQMRKLS